MINEEDSEMMLCPGPSVCLCCVKVPTSVVSGSSAKCSLLSLCCFFGLLQEENRSLLSRAQCKKRGLQAACVMSRAQCKNMISLGGGQ
jgi:hypothetical protein